MKPPCGAIALISVAGVLGTVIGLHRPLGHEKSPRVLAEWVTTILREAILNGQFHLGEKLDQNGIAEELEVSRTPVREAIRKLESEGLVEVRPHRGAFIATVSRQDIRDIYEIRGLLEPEVVRQITPRIPEPVLDELDRSLAKTQTQFDAGDVSEHFESDIYFHDTVLGFVENSLLKGILDALQNRISIIRRFANSKPGPHLVESLREHRAVLQSIRQRDPERAAELMRYHLEQSALRIQRLTEQGTNETWNG